MNVTPHQLGDIDELRQRICKEANAKQRDRYRAVLLALEGLGATEIAARLARSRNFVQRWVYAYRDDGLGAIHVCKQLGQPMKLPKERHEEFLETLTEQQRILRGKDIAGILETHFGVTYTLDGVYRLLHRLGYEPLKPRPVNPKKNPKEEAAWKKAAPLLSRPSKENIPIGTSRSGSRMNVDSGKKDV